MELIIKPKAPYNFNLVTSLYSKFPSQCVDIYNGKNYQRAFEVNDSLFFVQISSIGSIKSPKLLVDIKPNPNKQELQELEEKIKFMFSTEEDLHGFYDFVQKDKRLSAIVKNLYGLKAPRTPTVFEALIIAISEQQIALPIAITLRKRLAEKYGKPLKVQGETFYTFPAAKTLAQAKTQDIRNLKFSTKKAEYIIDLSQKVLSAKINLEEMKAWSLEQILENLTKHRGIGPWTVEYMMVRGMGRYDALPASDIGLRNSLTKFLKKEEKVTEKEVRDFLEPFGKYQGQAAFYLIYNYAFQKYPASH